jgi:hypothetical protein
MDPKTYLTMLAEALTLELTANSVIRRFTNNPDLIGAFAEATVRRFVHRTVFPLHVSRGAIIYEGNCGTSIKSQPPQIDTIIWTPGFLPSPFEVGDFALVCRGSAVAALEIKSTNYSKAAQKISETVEASADLLRWPSDPSAALFDSRWSWALGVICIRTEQPDARLDALIEERKAVSLLTQGEDGRISADSKAIPVIRISDACTKKGRHHRWHEQR